MPNSRGKRTFSEIDDNVTVLDKTWSSKKIQKDLDESGDVKGPISSTDNAIVRFGNTSGKLVKNSGVTISDTSVVNVSAGTEGDPALIFNNDTSSGLYSSGPGLINISTGGSKRLTLSSASNLQIYNSQYDNTCHLIDTGNTDQSDIKGYYAIQGQAGIWMDSLFGNVGGGATSIFCYPAANDILLATNYQSAPKRIRMKPTGDLHIEDGVLLTNTAGSPSAPEYSFLTNTNCGMYASGPNTLNFSTNSINRLVITSSGDVHPDGDDTHDLGLVSKKWKVVYSTKFNNGTDSFNYGFDTTKGGAGSMIAGEGTTGQSMTGAGNLIIGYNAGPIIASSNQTIIGTSSGQELTTGLNCTFFGYESGQFCSGSRCTAIGATSLKGSTGLSDGNYNVGVGYGTLSSVTSGSNSTGVGYFAGDTISTGSFNTFVGNGSDGVAGLNNQTAIGNGAICDSANQITLGNTLVTVIRSMSNNGCDLGTSAKKFKNGYFGGVLEFEKPFAEMYENVTATTIISVTNVWYKANFTSTSANANNVGFTHSTNRLTYTGTLTKNFHCGVTICARPSTPADHNYEFGLFKNGVLVPGSIVALHMINTGHDYSTAIHSIPQLTTNDYIELWVRRTTSGSQDVEVRHMNMFALALPNAV